MKRFYAKLAIAAAVALGGSASMMPASAAPPTVTPSPGYDARLQEQRGRFMNPRYGLPYRFPGAMSAGAI